MIGGQPPGVIRSWLNRLFEAAVLLVIVALLLNWAWQLLRPLVPVLVVAGGIVAVGTLARRRYRQW